VALLVLIVIVDLLSIASFAIRLDLLDQIASGTSDEVTLAAHDRWHLWSLQADRIVFNLTGLAFVVWFVRAYHNLDGIGAVRSEHPRWAFWGLLIPVINYYKPYQLMRECFVAFGPVDDKRLVLVKMWWGLYLFDHLLVFVFALSPTDFSWLPLSELAHQTSIDSLEETLHVRVALLECERVAYTLMIRHVTEIMAAFAAIPVVRTLTAWQSDAHHEVQRTV